jgi:hypothetical protein
VEPPPADAYSSSAAKAETPSSIFESIFDPDKLVPVVLPESPAAPQPSSYDSDSPSQTQSTPRAEINRPQAEPRADAVGPYSPAVVDAGKMTPVTFGPPKSAKPAAAASKKKAASKQVPDDDILEPAVAKPSAMKSNTVRPDAVKPAAAKPPVTAKYHLPEPPIPLP